MERQEAFLRKTKEDKIRKEENDNAKLLATEVEASRVEAARVEADNVEAARVEATRVEAERVEAERVEADDAEYAKAGADKEDAAKAEAIGAEAAIAEASKAAVSDEVMSDDLNNAAAMEDFDPAAQLSEGFLLSSTTQRKSNAQNNKNKKSRPNVSDEEVFDDQKVSGLGVEGIQQMSGESQATSKAGLSPNSQATSKAGLSFDSLATFGSDQLKVIVPDEVLSVSSTDSSPRHHKPAANHQEDWNDADGKSD